MEENSEACCIEQGMFCNSECNWRTSFPIEWPTLIMSFCIDIFILITLFCSDFDLLFQSVYIDEYDSNLFLHSSSKEVVPKVSIASFSSSWSIFRTCCCLYTGRERNSAASFMSSDEKERPECWRDVFLGTLPLVSWPVKKVEDERMKDW